MFVGFLAQEIRPTLHPGLVVYLVSESARASVTSSMSGEKVFAYPSLQDDGTFKAAVPKWIMDQSVDSLNLITKERGRHAARDLVRLISSGFGIQLGTRTVGGTDHDSAHELAQHYPRQFPPSTSPHEYKPASTSGKGKRGRKKKSKAKVQSKRPAPKTPLQLLKPKRRAKKPLPLQPKKKPKQAPAKALLPVTSSGKNTFLAAAPKASTASSSSSASSSKDTIVNIEGLPSVVVNVSAKLPHVGALHL